MRIAVSLALSAFRRIVPADGPALQPLTVDRSDVSVDRADLTVDSLEA